MFRKGPVSACRTAISRLIRLAWLSPKVLERLVLRREPRVLSIRDLCGVAELPWVDQPGRVFD